MKEHLGYQDQVCVVTGAASGMGKATAALLVELGAKVYALDISPIDVPGVETCVHVDLSDKSSIDAAFAQLPQHIDRYFGVAGVMGAAFPFMKTLKINLISNMYVAKELLPQRMGEGGAIAFISSAIANGWQKPGNMKYFKAVVDAGSWDEAVQFCEASGIASFPDPLAYPFSKMAMNYLLSTLQGVYGPKHIRVNAVCPGATRSAFGSESVSVHQTSEEESMMFAGYSGRMAGPEEMAYPLLYLNSKYASYISGAIICADYGVSAELEAGLRPNPIGGTFDEMFSQGQG